MSFSIIPSDTFQRKAKRLIRKFPSLKEVRSLHATLRTEPKTGTPPGNKIFNSVDDKTLSAIITSMTESE